MVYESKDHENDLMIPQVVSLSFQHPIFQETPPKLDSTGQEIKIGRCRLVHTSVKRQNYYKFQDVRNYIKTEKY